MSAALVTDYWGIVSRSLRIAWDHKFLWFFGFFASLGGGDVIRWVNQGGSFGRQHLLPRAELLALAVMALVVLWLVLFVLNLISRGAVISGASDADSGRPITFEGAWVSGLRAFWRMLALLVLSVLAVVVVSIIFAVPIFLPLVAGVPGIVIAIVIGAILFLPYLAFLFLLTFTITYAEREVVIGGAGVFDAIAAGWALTRTYLAKSLLVWLISLLSGIIFVIGLGIALLVVAVPFVVIGIFNLAAGLVLGIPVGLALVCVALGAYGTYIYSLWTLTYREFRRLGEAPAEGGSVPVWPGGESR